MEELKKLYPLKFLPVAETFEWGGTELTRRYAKRFVVCDEKGREKKLAQGSLIAESHEIADLGYRDSQVFEGWLAGNTLSELMDMYLDRLVGEGPFEYYGRQFPVGVKFIDATSRTPLMVSPDDTTAQERYDFLGKAKMWYVVEAKPEAKLYLGFRRDVNSGEFYEACLAGNPENLLNIVKPRRGEQYMLTPGEVHAAEGVVLLEVSEASPLDFCLTGWGKPLPQGQFDDNLNLIEALDFINFNAHSAAATDIQQFTATKMDLTDPLHVRGAEYGCFAFYTCVEGEAAVQIRSDKQPDANYLLKSGESILIPAEVEEYYLLPRTMGTILIEVTMPARIEPDQYIDPTATPTLEGEEQ